MARKYTDATPMIAVLQERREFYIRKLGDCAAKANEHYGVNPKAFKRWRAGMIDAEAMAAVIHRIIEDAYADGEPEEEFISLPEDPPRP